MAPQYWLMKSEPSAFSYDDLERQGWTHWDGVRNHQAKNNLMAMREGDLALIYHSVTDKYVIGLAKVTQAAYPDPTDDTGKWVAVRVEPLQRFKKPVTLEEMKATPALSDIPLIKQSRLSVLPLPEAAFTLILKLGKTPLPVSTP